MSTRWIEHGGSRRRELDRSKVFPGHEISVERPSQPLVEGLGAINVGHRDGEDLEFQSTVAAVETPVTDCCSVPTCVLLMVLSFGRDFRGELVQAFAKHPVERRKRMITSARIFSGVPSLIASTSSPTISPARGVTMVAPTRTPRSRSATSSACLDGSRGCSRARSRRDPRWRRRPRCLRPCRSFRHPDRRDFGIGECHPRDRRVIGPRVHPPQSARHDLPVIVGDVSEPAESRDVTGSENARLRFER